MKTIWTSVLALCILVGGLFVAAPFAAPQIALASPGFATIDAAGILQRIAALEDRVSALEAQLSALNAMSHSHPVGELHTHQAAPQSSASQSPASQAPTATPRPTATPLSAPQTMMSASAYGSAEIVSSPGGSVLRTVSDGTALDIVGYYNDADNITWYKLGDGGWISYLSVRNAPTGLSYIYYPQK